MRKKRYNPDKLEGHHVIPISIGGEDIPENIEKVPSGDHTKLHQTQNVHRKKVRQYRKRVNDILVPNDYVFDTKQALWEEYMSNAIILPDMQLKSLGQQINRYMDMNNVIDRNIDLNLDTIVEQLIDQQRYYVRRLLAK